MSQHDAGRLTRIGRTTVYENPWVRMTEDAVVTDDGSTTTYAVLHTHDFAVVIPSDGERYLLVEQFRYPIDRRTWEFPQGTLSGAQPTDPQRIAEVELAEEAGLTAGHYAHLGYLHESAGRSGTGFHVFLATRLTVGEPHPDPEEVGMRSAWFTLEEIWAKIADGTLTDASSVAALALLGRREAENY